MEQKCITNSIQLFFALCAVLLCTSCGQAGMSNGLWITDVSKNYPKVQLALKDIADVEYIKLANDSDFLVKSRALVFSDNHILTRGAEAGEILVFDRQGNFRNKFSHYGNGPHEYNYITNLCLDEKRNELYVHDVFLRKILVYDLEGEFVREIQSGDGRFIYQFDDNSFLVYCAETNKVDPAFHPYFALISKDDGSIRQKIDVPFASDSRRDLAVTKEADGGSFTYTAMHLPIVRYGDGYILNELSSDTIYTYSYDKVLTPFMVRKPSIASMGYPVYLESGVVTDRYIFLNRISVNENSPEDMFPSVKWVCDRETGQMNEYEVVNEDYPDKKIVLESHIVNCDVRSGYGVTRYNADGLLSAYEEGKLNGRLKEIAATLNEEDNDVLMVLRFK